MNGSTLSVIGLCLNVVGVVMLFRVAPEKHLHPQAMIAFKLNEGQREEWEAGDRKRRMLARASLALITIGFVLQIIGETSSAP